jgi:hypothetical protein
MTSIFGHLLAWLKKRRIGSAEWLICMEHKYGGMVTNIPRRVVSPLDPRSREDISTGGMTGGDRMENHRYAAHYAAKLRSLVKYRRKERLVICEIGILRGTGLAIWCDLFPQSRVIGLDIDLSHAQENSASLCRQGAFSSNKPELHEFDQLRPSASAIKRILGEKRINLCIDDGLHTHEAIFRTFECMRIFLDNDFTYFIEDNDTVADVFQARYSQYLVEQLGELTIVSPR